MCTSIRVTAVLWLCGLVAPVVSAASVDYQRDIRPLFEESCGKCHAGAVSMGKLKLDSEAAILSGGQSGPAIVPGKSGDSLLVKRILGTTDAPRMPLGGDPLPGDKVKLIQAWIDQNNFSAVQASNDSTAATETPQAAQSALFASKVRPILAARCYGCHGPDAQQAGLRLDSLAALLKGSDSGKIVIPGHSGDSRLIRRLMAKERPQMPYGGPPLTAEQIGTLQQWIDAGAPGPDSTAALPPSKPLKHWAYVKPVRPAIPTVTDKAWVRNPIDNFILARLEKEGLKPAPEADKPTLIRRVYLDLVGVPPSPSEVDEFVADRSPDAYDKVVDRLLASPHYGERWARPWLDLARYADTNGYEKDSRRTAWEYRDWLIRALNKDLPFDQFTIDQIAGDMLPHPTQDQLIATGFHRNTMLNQEGGVDPEEYYWYELVDRVNTTASVWLGSTLGCAQCHNHKFDPFTQKDYYRFLAFFSNSEYKIGEGGGDHWAMEPDLELPTPEQDVQSKKLRAEAAQLQHLLDTQTPELDMAQKSWESQMANAAKNWTALRPDHYESKGGADLKLLPDASLLAAGKNPQADTYTIEARAEGQQISAVRIEVLRDGSLPNGGPGRDAEGNFFLSDLDLQVAPANHPEAKKFVPWKDAIADEAQRGYEPSALLHQKTGVRGWAIDASPGAPDTRQAVLVPEHPFGFPEGTILTFTLKHELRHATRNIGRFRLSVTTISEPEFIVRIPARVRPILQIAPEARSAEQKDQLAAAYRAVSPLLDGTRKQLADIQDQIDKLGIATAMILREKSPSLKPAAYIRERGSFLSKGDLVYANVPSALNPLPPGVAPNRLALANWLVSKDNPLTARVAVNHFWETIFGHGIVETAEDFGTQGDAPSHPELLDWLATEFMDQGWSMKKIQRLMVTSATYRESSRVTPQVLARDPYNKLYAHGPRIRVEAETVHDIALSVSGLLSSKMYGPSVFPYQPEGIWDVSYSSDKWIESKGDDRYRRSVYTFMRRSAPYPSLSTFDAPSREFCTVRRVRTNTPLQALTTLNDPFFFDTARALAVRLVKEGGETEQSRLKYGFRLVTSRLPDSKEFERVQTFYEQQLAAYRRNEKSAESTVGPVDSKAAPMPELAAWTMVANVLLNLDETISKE